MVDLGSNIGISALYFLTRNTTSKCILYEPDPKNIEKLKRNLKGFEDRYTLFQNAVADREGELRFGVEASGRYGGIGLVLEDTIAVNCLHINDVIKNALLQSSQVDILKIDAEGVEVQTVNGIAPDLLEHISKIYLEADPAFSLHRQIYRNVQYGSVRQLSKKG